MIKFHCKHCSGKIGVKDEFAGKRVRCPKCKEPVRVPKPAVEDDFELEMVSAGDSGDDFDLEMVSEGDAGGALYALAEMEAGAAAEIPNHQQQPAGNTCPQCGNACAPRAKVCVGCGYSFKNGGQASTTVQATSDAQAASKQKDAEDPNYMSPGKMVLSGLFLMAVGVGIYYYLWDFEHSNDTERSIYWLIAVLYNFGGIWVATLPVFLLGLAGTLKGLVDMRRE